ncbi:hypothetical protein MMC25_005867 [Agyrium rufum]|nr:hypothetical protein [Agyrium rufum]
MAKDMKASGEADISVMKPWLYDLVLWSFSILVDLFFREVHPRGSWRIPRKGPIIFVAAPHANQFLDPLILMRVVRNEAHRRMAILTAAHSMKRRFIGAISRAMGAVPVARAQDAAKAGAGTVYLPDANEPTRIKGIGSKFDEQAQVGGTISLPTVNGNAASAEILEILGPTDIRLKRPFSGEDALKQLTAEKEEEDGSKVRGTKYKAAPKIDQTAVYNAVFKRLNDGECICIFPEGGSHDRTELLPLKAGVAIMALGALVNKPDSGLKIVPCGMNYFHAHKFRSRAVVEFGPPLDVPEEFIELYKSGDRRESTKQLLDIIHQSLIAVTVTSPDYDTLMLIQAARRLYNPKGKKLPLPMIVELNRRLVKGYTQYKDDPRIINLKTSVNKYNKQLRLLGVRDHQVEYAKFSIAKVVFTLTYRLGKIAILAVGTIPGLILFAPIFVASKVISIRKSREALAASTVKLQGRDVIATWKLLVALALAPTLYALYTIIITYWTYRNRVQGYIPQWVPLWLVSISSIIFLISVTFAALRFGETGMDIFKSLRPLMLSLNPTSANTFYKLRKTREKLSADVTDIINTLGPEMFSDFDHARIVADPFQEGAIFEPGAPRSPTSSGRANRPNHSESPRTNLSRRSTGADAASIGGGSSVHGNLPRNESFHDLGKMSLFATRPSSQSHSRSGSETGLASLGGDPPLKRFSTVSSKESFDEVSKRIRGAMAERGKVRSRRISEGNGWDMAGDETPEVDEDEEHVVEGKKDT